MCSVSSSRSPKTWQPRHVPLPTTSLRHLDAHGEHMFAQPAARHRHRVPLSRTAVLWSCALAQCTWAREEAQPLRDQPSMTLSSLVYIRLSPVDNMSTRKRKSQSQSPAVCPLPPPSLQLSFSVLHLALLLHVSSGVDLIHNNPTLKRLHSHLLARIPPSRASTAYPIPASLVLRE